MMRRSVVWGLALSVVLAGGVAGAHKLAFAGAETGEACAAPAHGMGFHGFVMAALDDVALRPEQRAAVEQLKADMKTQAATVAAAHERVLAAVATSVEAGAIDHGTIDPLVAATQAAANANRPAFEDGANRLHALLDATQRQALVDAVRTRMYAAHGGHPFHGGPAGGGDHLTRVAAELGLSDDQVATLRAKFAADPGPGPEEGPHGGGLGHFAHMKAVAEAFVSDSFDAHALGLGEHAARMPMMANKMLSRIEVALPVLTPPQRTALAQMIRDKRLENPG